MEITNDLIIALLREQSELLRQLAEVRSRISDREPEFYRALKRKTEAQIQEKLDGIAKITSWVENNLPATTTIPWDSTAVNFADVFSGLWDEGYFRGVTRTELLRIAAPHFGLEWEGLRQGLELRENKEGRRFKFPPNDKKRKSK